MTLFFDKSISETTEQFFFNKEESKHLAKVIRKKVGDSITVTNGNGLEWIGKLSVVSTLKSVAERKQTHLHLPKATQIHLAIAPTKNNNRMEWLVEKLTELGIHSIHPILCQRSERKVIKKERFEKIAISALKQSQQFFLPQIDDLIPFTTFIKNIRGSAAIAHCENTPKTLLSSRTVPEPSITILIGPEGDFSPEEIDLAQRSNIESVSLGKQRFRTETAGLFACHT
ncbi:MAG: 16S rRNA (uracil(1498)-N(3))-methyltransferase, partial [Flavobacteriaceae bacterium]